MHNYKENKESISPNPFDTIMNFIYPSNELITIVYNINEQGTISDILQTFIQ